MGLSYPGLELKIYHHLAVNKSPSNQPFSSQTSNNL